MEARNSIDYDNLGRIIREAREKLHMTRAQLAEQAGISESYVSAIEKKRDAKASLRVVACIFHTLGLSLDRIFLRSADNFDPSFSAIHDLLQGCTAYQLGVLEALIRSFLSYDRIHDKWGN